MTDSKEPDDFARALEALVANMNGGEAPGEPQGRVWPSTAHARRGLLAALREMRDGSEAQVAAAAEGGPYRLVARAMWRAMADELIRQGEAATDQKGKKP